MPTKPPVKKKESLVLKPKSAVSESVASNLKVGLTDWSPPKRKMPVDSSMEKMEAARVVPPMAKSVEVALG